MLFLIWYFCLPDLGTCKLPDTPSVTQPFWGLALPGMFAQLREGIARGGWMPAWNNLYLNLVFSGRRKWNLYVCIKGKGSMYFILGSSQLKKENWLCGGFYFLLGKVLGFCMRWCDEHERKKPHSLNILFGYFLKLVVSCDKCSSSL